VARSSTYPNFPHMTRVLLVHQPLDGGVGRHIRDVASGLVELGYEVVVCSPAQSPDLTAQASSRHLDMQRAIAARTDLSAVGALARIVRELRPDVIHAHSSKAGAVTRLARFAHPHVPVVYSPHLYAFAGHFERSIERRAYRAFERILAPLANRVVCVCEAEARLAKSIGPPSRVRVIHNGVEPAHRGPVDARIAQLRARGPVFGVITLLHARKGVSTLIDATPKLLERYPQAQVAIAGDGPELDAYRAQAQRLNVAHAVHFLGLSTDTLSVLRGIDVQVHPSWAESFPYVILEGMSLGRSIIATDVGGTGEAIVDGESGLLVPAHDAPALSRAMIELLDDPERSKRMGDMALRRADTRFTLAEMIDRLAGVYDELGASRPARQAVDAPNSRQALASNQVLADSS
jgi:glycosyltransferase involved in cell wall biosynthesis